MPKSSIHFYREENGKIPLLDWLTELRNHDSKVFEKCFACIERLKTYGHELRRPHADYLRDGIYELRIRVRNMQYRVLYFFQGLNVIILSHGLVKEGNVPAIEINRALTHKKACEKSSKVHICKEEDYFNG